MRRKQDTLIPIEISIISTALALFNRGDGYFHGFLLAKEMQEQEGARLLTAHGTLYKALGRLAERGLLESHWEDAETAAAENRPRRRLYRVTGEGAKALLAAEIEAPRRLVSRRVIL